MKSKLRPTTWIPFILAASILACTTAAGTVSWELTAKNTIDATITTVNVGMGVYFAEVKAGKVSAATQATVRADYQKYFDAMTAAQAAIIKYKSDANQPTAQAAVDAITAAAAVLAGDIAKVGS